MKAVAGLIHGLSYCRLMATKSAMLRHWTGFGDAIIRSNAGSSTKSKVAKRHFSVLTCGRPTCSSENVLSVMKRTHNQYRNDYRMTSLSRMSVAMRRYSKKPNFLSIPHVLMPNFPVAVFPTFSQILNPYVKGAKEKKTLNSVDKDFVFEDFLTNANKGIFTVAKLLTLGKVSDLEELLTPKAFRMIVMNYDKLTTEHHRLLDSMNQTSPAAVYQYHHVQAVIDLAENEPVVTVKLQFMVSFFNIFVEEKKIMEVALNTAGFERLYTSNVDFLELSARSKGEDVKKRIMSDLASLNCKSDNYWKIFGITFGNIHRKDFKLMLV
ncbi:uncharacterized protein LOC117315420 [Pecten maximus]|uniref:uncharacterized protein LOC117315420 n=1 Tax=Pecten maximus TaxID=6579 RepID=UPI0014587761|nr:uncharacterized protein LOC117315420 [Pecten maximus]